MPLAPGDQPRAADSSSSAHGAALKPTDADSAVRPEGQGDPALPEGETVFFGFPDDGEFVQYPSNRRAESAPAVLEAEGLPASASPSHYTGKNIALGDDGALFPPDTAEYAMGVTDPPHAPLPRLHFWPRTKASCRVPWIHPLAWTNLLTPPQRLIEINKFRTLHELTPWRKWWSREERRKWAGDIDDPLDADLQDAMMADCTALCAVADPAFTVEQLEVELKCPDARLPSRNNPEDAGLDLFGMEDVILEPFGRTSIETGIAVKIPD